MIAALFVLETILAVAAVFLLLAAGLWVWLLLAHAAAERRERRARRITDDWLDRLLPVLEGEADAATLPTLRNKEELDAVLALLRDLMERFKGSYRNHLSAVLSSIGAIRHGRHLLGKRLPSERIRGAALLGWCGPDAEVDSVLTAALADRDAGARLEIADALVRRGAAVSPREVLEALCRDEAARSLRARDLFRRWGEESAIDWGRLLAEAPEENARVLVLEALRAAGRAEWTGEVSAIAMAGPHRVTVAALRVLAAMGDPEGAEGARWASGATDPEIRREAVAALVACGSPAVDAGQLVARLKDEDFDVRRAAMDGLQAWHQQARLKGLAPADRWQEELFREVGLTAPSHA